MTIPLQQVVPAGRVASLHLHPAVSGEFLTSVDSIRVLESQGVEGEPRYFGRKNSFGQTSRRQITLIEREQILEHATAMELGTIPPGVVRSNIETEGINLVACVGRRIQAGEAVLMVYEARRPCAQMDAIAPGLRARMEDGRQGVLAEVVQSGVIRLGDEVRVI